MSHDSKCCTLVFEGEVWPKEGVYQFFRCKDMPECMLSSNTNFSSENHSNSIGSIQSAILNSTEPDNVYLKGWKRILKYYENHVQPFVKPAPKHSKGCCQFLDKIEYNNDEENNDEK